MCTRSTYLSELNNEVMVLLIMFMFVVAILAAIMDLQISFAIESSPLLLFGGQNMRDRPHKCAFLFELNNEVIAISVFSMSLVAILDFHTSYAIDTSLDE